MSDLRAILNLDFDSEPKHYTQQITALMRWMVSGLPIANLIICVTAVALNPLTRIVATSAFILVASVYYSFFLLARSSGRDARFFYAFVSAEDVVSIYNPMDWVVLGGAIASPLCAIYLFFFRHVT